jgi:3-methylfumaryl-CoA hydratase
MRRMFAGTNIRWHAPLRFGVAATRVRAVVATQKKQGRTGELVFVTVRDVYTQSDSVAMTETQTIVYRSAEQGTSRLEGATVPENASTIAYFSVDERTIFRYSALTFNTHRIHYDQRWARHEGYSDIVVQGPLQAALLARARSMSTPHADADFGVDIRFSAPVLGPQRLTVYSDPSDAAVCLSAGANGRIAATARWISRDDEPQG